MTRGQLYCFYQALKAIKFELRAVKSIKNGTRMRKFLSKTLQFCTSAVAIAALSISLSTTASATIVNLETTLDGNITRFISGSTTFTSSDTAQSIGIITHAEVAFTIERIGILAFDLSGIADGSTINSASLQITLTESVESSVFMFTKTTVHAYAGDNVIGVDDYSPLGVTTVFSEELPGGVSGVAGDVLNLVFNDLTPIETLLTTDILELRIQSGPGRFSFASLENIIGASAAVLSIDFTAPSSAVVPVPAALPLFGTGLALMGFVGWRRKRKATTTTA